MFTLVRTLPRLGAPITLTEAKTQTRVDHDDEDLLLQHYIDAASLLDGPTGLVGRCLVTQSWQMDFGPSPARSCCRFPTA